MSSAGAGRGAGAGSSKGAAAASVTASGSGSRRRGTALDIRYFQTGLKVWVKNPYPAAEQHEHGHRKAGAADSTDDGKKHSQLSVEADADPSYRSGWLPHALCGRPLWVPAEVVQGPDAGTTGTDGIVTVATAFPQRVEVDVLASQLFVMNQEEHTSAQGSGLSAAARHTPAASADSGANVVGLDDMVEFSHLHEAALLHNTVARFLRGLIYTRAGEILLALNPYAVPLDSHGISIYDPVYVHQYSNRPSAADLEHMPAAKREAAQLPPHIFDVAGACYAKLMAEGESQSCVISGESGAGKTETTKLILQYLTHASTGAKHSSAALAKDAARRRSVARRGSLGSATNPFHSSDDGRGHGVGRVEGAVLESNPVLEAFGNAKTVRNNNSSRFGKLLKLFVAPSTGSITGAFVSHYLLEKSRVTTAGAGERSFHVFYQLLAGSTPSQRAALRLGDAASYRFLSEGGADVRVEGVDDAAEFGRVRQALTAVGVSEAQQEQVWRIVSAVLLTGNLRFTGDDAAAIAKPSVRDANTVADLLGLPRPALALALTTSAIVVGGQQQNTNLRRDEAESTALALAKHMYGKLFTWIVTRVNAAVANAVGAGGAGAAGDARGPFIGILDIFGFEVFQRNGFEQLCINYANERLQQFFTAHVFALEAATYEAEAIDYAGVEFEDNHRVVALIDHKPRGVLAQLDEACLFPRSTDAMLVAKLHTLHARKNPHYSRPSRRHAATCFVVHHSAASVTYDAAGFIEKNKDRLSASLKTLLTDSSLPVVSEAVAGPAGASGKAAAKEVSSHSLVGSAAFLGARFKDDVGRLVALLRSTRPHFVRCLKPNLTKRAAYAQPAVVHHQLAYLGVLDSIRIRHSGFSFRTPYAEFYARYILIAGRSKRRRGGGTSKPSADGSDSDALPYPAPPGADMRALCQRLLASVVASQPLMAEIDLGEAARFGLTRVFLRKHAAQALEALREVVLQDMDRKAVVVQSAFRGHAARRELADMWEGFLRLQAAYRAKLYRQQWLLRMDALRVVQRSVRAWLVRRWFGRLRTAAGMVQTWWRRIWRRSRWAYLRRCLRVSHALARGYLVRRHVLLMLSAVRRLQRVARSFLARNRVHWDKVHAAILMQAAWRGFQYRSGHEEVLAFLALMRERRAEDKAAASFQAAFRMVLHRRRYAQLKAAATRLQHWGRGRNARTTLLRAQWAAQRIQAATRGMQARGRVRGMRTANQVADEAWRLKTVREREALQLARANTSLARARVASAVSRRQPVTGCAALDVDMVLDASDVYEGGWSAAFGSLDSDLAVRGHYAMTVEVGGSHTAVLSDDGRVYTWGWGDRGQLGRGAQVTSTGSGAIMYGDGGDGASTATRGTVGPTYAGPSEEVAAKPGLVTALLFAPEEVAAQQRGSAHGTGWMGGGTPSPSSAGVTHRLRVKQIAAGEDHTVALSDAGRVYTWGCGRRGQLGLGPDIATCYEPRHVSSLRRRVAEVAAGAAHTVALVVAGSVYTWGAGPALGLGVFTGSGDRSVPCAVRALTKHRVRHIAAGWRFTVATTHGGDVYTWGAGGHGQLGVGDTRDRLVPSLVKALAGNQRHARIATVAAGARHCVALSATTRVYTWGWNAWGQLGLGDSKDRNTPVWLQHGRLRRVSQVAAGWRHSCVLTETGDMAAWGCTGAVRSQRLAHDPEKDNTHFTTHVPMEVPFHDWPGRAPLRLSVGSSDTLSVTCCVYTQAPVSRAQLQSATAAAAAARRGDSDVGSGAAGPAGVAVSNGPTKIATEAAALVAEAAGQFDVLDAMSSPTTQQPRANGSSSHSDGGSGGRGSRSGANRGKATLHHTPIRTASGRRAAGTSAAAAAAPTTPGGSVAAHLASLSPAQLKHLSAGQLRMLVAQLQQEQQAQQQTREQGGGSPGSSAAQRPAVKTRAEAMQNFMASRGLSAADPVQHALEAGWMAHFTGGTTPGDGSVQRRVSRKGVSSLHAAAAAAGSANRDLLDSESAARTELLAFHAYAAATTRVAGDDGAVRSSPLASAAAQLGGGTGPVVGTPGSAYGASPSAGTPLGRSHASPSAYGMAGSPGGGAGAGVHAKETSRQRAERKAALAAARRAAEAERRAELRRAREGGVQRRDNGGGGDNPPVSSMYFTTAHLVATSNEDMEVGDVIAQYGLHVQQPATPSSASGYGHSPAVLATASPVSGVRRGVTVRALLGSNIGGGAGAGGSSGSVASASSSQQHGGEPTTGHQPSHSPAQKGQPSFHSAPDLGARQPGNGVGQAAQEQWSGRRPSSVHRIHRRIEADVLAKHSPGAGGSASLPSRALGSSYAVSRESPRQTTGRAAAPVPPPVPLPPSATGAAAPPVPTDLTALQSRINNIRAKASADVARLWDPSAAPAAGFDDRGSTGSHSGHGSIGSHSGHGSDGPPRRHGARRSTTNDLASYVRKYHEPAPGQGTTGPVPLPSLSRLIASSHSAPGHGGDGSVGRSVGSRSTGRGGR